MEHQKPIREVVVGDVAGEMVIEAYKQLLTWKREYAMEDGMRYQEHELNLSLADAYAEDGVRGKHYAAMLAFPEGYYFNMSFERVIVLSDTNPKCEEGDRKVVGVVIFRESDLGSNRDERLWRLKVTLNARYAGNGNAGRKWTVENLKPIKAEDLALAQATADYGSLVGNDEV